MASYQTLQVETKASGILLVTLNRPDKLNALNEALLQDLKLCLTQAKTAATVKGILLTGAGKAFCAGADIARLAKLDSQQALAFAEQGQAIFRLLETLGKPSVAAINGVAFGGGCELAMSTSLRIAATTAAFAQPEVKLGIIPGYGGTQRLARLVGKGRAIDLCLTGRSLQAAEALQWGLISEVVAPEDLLIHAEEILLTILRMGPLAVASVLAVIDAGYDLPLDDALRLEAKYFAMTCATHDKTEGVAAFLEKRAAHFSGK